MENDDGVNIKQEPIELSSDDSNSTAADAEVSSNSTSIKIEPEDYDDELPNIDPTARKLTVPMPVSSQVDRSDDSRNCSFEKLYNDAMMPVTGSNSYLAHQQDPTSADQPSGDGNMALFGRQGGGTDDGLSRNVTLPTRRSIMYPGLGLGTTEDWSQYNILDPQNNNFNGHMDAGRNQQNRPMNIHGGRNQPQQARFSQHDPMVDERNQAQQIGFTQHAPVVGGGTRIATHAAGSGPRMSRMGSGGSSGIARLISTSAREIVESHFVVLRSSSFTQDKVESGEVQRIVGFKAGDRIGNLCMEPRHVLVEKYFREASEARAYHATCSKNWFWDGFRVDAELNQKSVIKTPDGAEPRKKWSRKKM